ncbi:MAG: TetR/AcrR family transcriptional regulator [Bacteroidales bacterium]|nr:TetR/AcrR family transcriptional regulator [Bacteroidales bacterium]
MEVKDKKNKIVETAIELFNTRGFKSVTMDDISTSIHISKRTLYELFSSKDELVLACMTQVHQEMGRQRLEFLEKANEPLLMTLFILRNVILNRAKYWRMFEEADLYYPEMSAQLIKSFGNKFKDSLHSVFEEAEMAGDLCGSVDIDAAIDLIITNIRHSRYKGDSDYEQFSSRMREACYTYLRGLLSVKAIERYDKHKDEFRRIIEKK